MKSTALLIDTNVVLDWILQREPFRTDSEKIINLCIQGEVQGYLACHTILNMFYILRKERSIAERKEILLMLCNNLNIIGINNKMLISVLCSDDLRDIEDDMQIQCAVDNNLDYIVTRDISDFKKSSVQILSPKEFLLHLGKA